MDELKQTAGEGMGANQDASKKVKSTDTLANKKKVKKQENSSGKEVLFSMPGGFKYKLPGKKQRILLGSIVIGLNAILVLVVALYFYNPSFQEFIYNVGRG